ncbi:MAG TPA: inositol monophosphatase family protein [Chloroflexia bacterium]|nr:inositol monophosphatase family protein [Chloroflexia bacterium]
MSTIPSYQAVLDVALDTAHAAAEILRAECARPQGPRRPRGHCPADDEAERLIRERLLEATPSWGYRGEETGFQSPAPGETHLWLVDPNDGTEAMQDGFRGHAVSIALLRAGELVLGVVYAVDAPDDNGDLFAWAEGCGPLTRKGYPVPPRTWPGALKPDGVVFVSQAADRHPYGNLKCVQPARFRDVPSIAYRLALAATEGVGAVSLNGPRDYDYGAGHAILKGAGGILVNERGQEVTYNLDGSSHVGQCFGGDPKVVVELAKQPWDEVPGSGFGIAAPPVDLASVVPVRLEPGRLAHATAALRRAQGCMFGQLAGDSLGALVEFQSAGSIARAYPNGGPTELADGGPHSIMAGQATDDSELALLLARSILRKGGFDADDVASLYAAWYHGWLHHDGPVSCNHKGCRPFDVGSTTAQALEPVRPINVAEHNSASICRSAANITSEANGALMRVSPIGIWGWQRPLSEVDETARADASLTHPHPVCQASSGLFAATIAHAVAEGGTPSQVYDWALEWARTRGVPETVMSALEEASTSPPADYMYHQGWVLIALQNAFYQLVYAPGAMEGVVRTVRSGGDTDTNGAICGALLGAVYGREAWPEQWQAMVLSCRPLHGVTPTHQPRPAAVWPADALQIAERLFMASSK